MQRNHYLYDIICFLEKMYGFSAIKGFELVKKIYDDLSLCFVRFMDVVRMQ